MAQAYPKQVERWGVFEIALPGRTDGNPFTDYEIHGTFTGKNENKTVPGFYDGAGIYKVRFMPSFEGEYQFKIEGVFPVAWRKEPLPQPLPPGTITARCGWRILTIWHMRTERPIFP